MQKLFTTILVGAIFIGVSLRCVANQVNIAVASNALAALKEISAEFTKQTGHTVEISSGSTGKLYAQIINGAPYDVFLAADESTPQKMEQAHLIVPNSRFTYALGKLVAWSDDASLLKSADMKSILLSPSVTRIAIANPKTAPYGLAAQQAMEKLGIWNSLQAKMIRGENVSQTFQFAASKNANIGFVAKSQIMNTIAQNKGSYQEVPAELYEPIRQQAVWLLRALHNTAAKEFVIFMRNDAAKSILMNQYGYGMEFGSK